MSFDRKIRIFKGNKLRVKTGVNMVADNFHRAKSGKGSVGSAKMTSDFS